MIENARKWRRLVTAWTLGTDVVVPFDSHETTLSKVETQNSRKFKISANICMDKIDIKIHTIKEYRLKKWIGENW